MSEHRFSALWWLLMVGIVVGIFHFGVTLGAFPQENPGLGTLIFAVVAVFTATYVVVIVSTDTFRSCSVSIGAFGLVAGATLPTWLALYGNREGINALPFLIGPTHAIDWGAALLGPYTEEWSKMVVVAALIVLYRGRLHRPIHGFYLGAAVGLGFQVTEDILYASRAALDDPNDNLTGAFDVLLFRGILGFTSHWVYTAIAGVGVAILLRGAGRHPLVRRMLIFAGLYSAACALHFLWNSPVDFGVGQFALGIKAFATGASAIVALTWVNRGEAHYLRALNTDPDFDVAFAGYRARRAHLTTIRRAEGRAAARACQSQWRKHYRKLQQTTQGKLEVQGQSQVRPHPE